MYRIRHKKFLPLIFSLFAAAFTSTAMAHAPSGAIFTTFPDGSEVNMNIYASKDLVYLDGGPGPGAPATAAGLDDGTYVFQVTNPNGRTLLSTDAAKCRQFIVTGGLITSVVASGCEHLTGVDMDHSAITVQLLPYDDTPNHGGVYKAWVVRVDDFLAGCEALGVSDGLDVVDCGRSHGNFHGFIPRHTKTDNYKVGETNNLEIDTNFIDGATGEFIDGMQLTWTDTLGSTNSKHSYYKPENKINHFAHIEAVESGVHQVTVDDQPGCTVIAVVCLTQGCGPSVSGPGTIDVQIKPNDPNWTHNVKVWCNSAP